MFGVLPQHWKLGWSVLGAWEQSPKTGVPVSFGRQTIHRKILLKLKDSGTPGSTLLNFYDPQNLYFHLRVQTTLERKMQSGVTVWDPILLNPFPQHVPTLWVFHGLSIARKRLSHVRTVPRWPAGGPHAVITSRMA